MRCADAEQMLPLVFDNDLDGASARGLRLHLCDCSECCELFAGMILAKAIGLVARLEWGRTSKRFENAP